jgi:hypothetical protein
LNTDTAAREVIATLRSFCNRCDALLKLIGGKNTLSRDETHQIRGLYASLKSDLKSETKRGATVRGSQSLNQFEFDYLMPALNEAICELRAPTNTNPITSNWHSELYAAKIDLLHMLRQLEEQFPEPH